MIFSLSRVERKGRTASCTPRRPLLPRGPRRCRAPPSGTDACLHLTRWKPDTLETSGRFTRGPPPACGRPRTNRGEPIAMGQRVLGYAAAQHPKEQGAQVTPDEQLMTALHDQHAGALFAFALRYVDDRDQARDIVQETLLRAWRHLDKIDPRARRPPGVPVHRRPQPADRPVAGRPARPRLVSDERPARGPGRTRRAR